MPVPNPSLLVPVFVVPGTTVVPDPVFVVAGVTVLKVSVLTVPVLAPGVTVVPLVPGITVGATPVPVDVLGVVTPVSVELDGGIITVVPGVVVMTLPRGAVVVLEGV